LDFVVEDEEVGCPYRRAYAKRKLKSMTIRLEERQIADAKMLAARLRMPYQTYLRAMLSQVLENEKRSCV
jgi:predicted DNA binding CopG/RHH family protein